MERSLVRLIALEEFFEHRVLLIEQSSSGERVCEGVVRVGFGQQEDEEADDKGQDGDERIWSLHLRGRRWDGERLLLLQLILPKANGSVRETTIRCVMYRNCDGEQ